MGIAIKTRKTLWLGALVMLGLPVVAQNGKQPAPFTVPTSRMPPATQAPGQKAVPDQQTPNALPSAPLPQPNQTTVDYRALAPLSTEPITPSAASEKDVRNYSLPAVESPSRLNTHWYSLVGPYIPAHTPELPAGKRERLDALMQNGKLYLSLQDALKLAIENNLDVEVSRYDLLLAQTDLVRAEGGGSLRGIDYTLTDPPPGVGAATSPLLNTATTTSNPASPTSVTVTDLSQITQTGNSTQQNLGENGSFTYSPGPQIPFFDPQLTGLAGFLRRSNQTSLETTTTTTTGTPSTSTPPLDFINASLDYEQGFAIGAQLDVYADNASQVLYASNSQYNPFHAPSTSVTLTQPLLRGRGAMVNLRFIRIAKINRHVSQLIFEQQLLETVYGISRLYYDLVSLGENIGVKQETLAAAQKLYKDDKLQAELGTLAPIELTRTQALVSSNRLDLIQAEAEYRQQESILREQLVRRMNNDGPQILMIVPTDKITVPDELPVLDVPTLTAAALANRPDLVQAGLQIMADQISLRGTRNGVAPVLNAYANIQTRGTAIVPYEALGSPGTGLLTPPPALTQGGLRLSTIYQGGVQLNLPLRNRIAQADAARDEIQLRQAQGRTAKLENDIRQQVQSAAIAVEDAHQAYAAAVESRDYQQQLLQAELDKFSVGESTNYLIVQDQAYLAQASSTEVAARSDWMKAQLALDRALGNLLNKNGILLDEAIAGSIKQ